MYNCVLDESNDHTELKAHLKFTYLSSCTVYVCPLLTRIGRILNRKYQLLWITNCVNYTVGKTITVRA